tara:strand:+ start:621 stop:2021 length:1401 start_codon:yes stop_codon:yes gene_type:complete
MNQKNNKRDSSIFPLDLFPKEIKDLIKELKDKQNFAEEFTAMGILYTVGLAVGNTHHVQALNTWNVNLSIWMMFVARSGLGKSPPMKFLLAPLRERDKELNKQFQEELKEFEEYEALSKDDKDDRDKVDEPKRQKHLFRDFTPERLVSSMSYNKRGIGVHSPEFKEMFNNLDRYAKSGALQMLYSWFDQEQHDKDTMSTELSFSEPFFSLSGGITTKLFNLFRHGKLSGQGFFERMLIIMVKDFECKYPEDIDSKYIEFWNHFIKMILHFEQKTDDKYNDALYAPMRYTEAAKLRLKEWCTHNFKKQKRDCDEYATIYSKQQIYLHKFAGLFNVLTAHCKSEQDENLGHIGCYSLNRAIGLIEYFEAAHKKIIGVGLQNEVHDLLKEDLKREVYSRLPKEEPFSKFQAVDLWTEVSMKIRNIDYLNDKEKSNISRTVGNWLKRHKDDLFKKDQHNLYRVVYPDYDF